MHLLVAGELRGEILQPDSAKLEARRRELDAADGKDDRVERRKDREDQNERDKLFRRTPPVSVLVAELQRANRLPYIGSTQDWQGFRRKNCLLEFPDLYLAEVDWIVVAL